MGLVWWPAGNNIIFFDFQCWVKRESVIGSRDLLSVQETEFKILSEGKEATANEVVKGQKTNPPKYTRKLPTEETFSLSPHWSTLCGRNLKMRVYSVVRPTVHTNPSRKRSFLRTLFKPEEFENAGFLFWCERKKFENRTFKKRMAVR